MVCICIYFRVLDANAYEKLHRVLVTYIGKCTLFLAGKLQNFDRDIVHAFCVTSLNEYAKSSLKDQIYKVIFCFIIIFAN